MIRFAVLVLTSQYIYS